MEGGLYVLIKAWNNAYTVWLPRSSEPDRLDYSNVVLNLDELEDEFLLRFTWSEVYDILLI